MFNILNAQLGFCALQYIESADVCLILWCTMHTASSVVHMTVSSSRKLLCIMHMPI